MSQQRFYRPIVHEAAGKPCITYPACDENPLSEVISRHQPGAIERFAGGIITRNSVLFINCDYLVTMPWRPKSEDAPVLDVWGFNLRNASDSGPLVTAGTFDMHARPVHDFGTTSGDALIILGNEELLRRSAATPEAYLQPFDQRWQSLPAVCRADIPFYTGEAA